MLSGKYVLGNFAKKRRKQVSCQSIPRWHFNSRFGRKYCFLLLILRHKHVYVPWIWWRLLLYPRRSYVWRGIWRVNRKERNKILNSVIQDDNLTDHHFFLSWRTVIYSIHCQRTLGSCCCLLVLSSQQCVGLILFLSTNTLPLLYPVLPYLYIIRYLAIIIFLARHLQPSFSLTVGPACRGMGNSIFATNRVLGVRLAAAIQS